MAQSGAQGSYARQLNQAQQFRAMNAGGIPSVGASAMQGVMGAHFGTGPRQQAPNTVSDSNPTPSYRLNLSESQSTAPSRDRQQYSGGVGGTGHHGSAAYFQTQVPQPNYGQGRPTTPGGYGQSQASYSGYSGGTSSGSAALYRGQSGGHTPQTPATPSSQAQTYGMRGGMYQQPANSYQQNFQSSQPSSAAYGGRYPGGVGGYANDPSQSNATAMAPQGQPPSGFAPQQYNPQQMGQHPGRHQGSFAPRGGGRFRGDASGGGGGGGGRGSLRESATPSGPPAAGPPSRQGTATTATEPSGPTPSGGPEATEDPNVAPEKRSIPRRMGIEPPIRNLLQSDNPMFQEPERFFRVLTLDVLGDKVPRSARAHQKPPPGRADFWSWDYRKDFLIKEITQFQPDIICLQEVDHYDFFEQKLAPMGYVGVFEPRKPTGQSRLYVVHGLATFWQATKFEYMGRRTEPLGAPFYVNEMGLCTRLCRMDRDPRTNPKFTRTQKNVVLDIWNVHLIEGRNRQAEKRRLKQAQELIEHIARVSSMDLDDRSYGRPRSRAERHKPLMEPKAQVERLVVVDPTTATTKNDGSFVATESAHAPLSRNVLDIESNKEDQPDNKEMDLAADLAESKEHEPGNALQEKFRALMNKAIITGGGPTQSAAVDVMNDTPEEDYDNKKRKMGPPPDSLRYPVICCGNFNCAPYPDPIKKGGKDIIQPFTYSYLTYNSEASRNNEWLQEAYNYLPHNPRHWTLDSAYASCFGEPSFTVWPDKKNEQEPYPADYVLFTKKPMSGLQVIGILEPLHEDWVKAGAAKSLPCHSFPSDHIPLICDFEFRQN